jgi:hypothetical protein
MAFGAEFTGRTRRRPAGRSPSEIGWAAGRSSPAKRLRRARARQAARNKQGERVRVGRVFFNIANPPLFLLWLVRKRRPLRFLRCPHRRSGTVTAERNKMAGVLLVLALSLSTGNGANGNSNGRKASGGRPFALMAEAHKATALAAARSTVSTPYQQFSNPELNLCVEPEGTNFVGSNFGNEDITYCGYCSFSSGAEDQTCDGFCYDPLTGVDEDCNGGWNPLGCCYCDEACRTWGDCCKTYDRGANSMREVCNGVAPNTEVCPVDAHPSYPTGSCMGNCDSWLNTIQPKPYAHPCRCDDACTADNACCTDYQQACGIASASLDARVAGKGRPVELQAPAHRNDAKAGALITSVVRTQARDTSAAGDTSTGGDTSSGELRNRSSGGDTSSAEGTSRQADPVVADDDDDDDVEQMSGYQGYCREVESAPNATCASHCYDPHASVDQGCTKGYNPEGCCYCDPDCEDWGDCCQGAAEYSAMCWGASASSTPPGCIPLPMDGQQEIHPRGSSTSQMLQDISYHGHSTISTAPMGLLVAVVCTGLLAAVAFRRRGQYKDIPSVERV